MTVSLTDEAQAEYESELAKEQTAREESRRVLRQAATDALKAVLSRADGTRLTLSEAGLSVRDTDLDAGRVVWSDGTVSIAAVLRDAVWRVLLVELVDGEWVGRSEPLSDLASLGAALAGA